MKTSQVPCRQSALCRADKMRLQAGRERCLGPGQADRVVTAWGQGPACPCCMESKWQLCPGPQTCTITTLQSQLQLPGTVPHLPTAPAYPPGWAHPAQRGPKWFSWRPHLPALYSDPSGGFGGDGAKLDSINSPLHWARSAAQLPTASPSSWSSPPAKIAAHLVQQFESQKPTDPAPTALGPVQDLELSGPGPTISWFSTPTGSRSSSTRL